MSLLQDKTAAYYKRDLRDACGGELLSKPTDTTIESPINYKVC